MERRSLTRVFSIAAIVFIVAALILLAGPRLVSWAMPRIVEVQVYPDVIPQGKTVTLTTRWTVHDPFGLWARTVELSGHSSEEAVRIALRPASASSFGGQFPAARNGMGSFELLAPLKFGLGMMRSNPISITYVASRVALKVPRGLAVYPGIAEAGGPLVLGDERETADDHFKIAVADEPDLQEGTDEYVRSVLQGCIISGEGATKVAGFDAKQLAYIDPLDANGSIRTYLTYFSRGGRLFKIFLTVDERSTRKGKLKALYDQLLSSIHLPE